MTPTSTGAPPPTPGAVRARAAAAGVLAAAAATAAGELAGQLLPARVSPVLSVGDRVVQLASPGARDAAIGALGTADKPVLVAGVLLAVALLGAAAGLLRATRAVVARWAGLGLVALLAVLGGAAVAAGVRAGPGTGVAVGVVLAAVGGGGLLLVGRPATPADVLGGPTRREFLVRAGALGAFAVAAGAAGRALADRVDVDALRRAMRLPTARTRATGDAVAAELGVPGLSPVLTPNADFYRIDTALSVPRVDPRSWRLRIDGRVRRPLELSYEDLAALPQVEADITLQCVSNEVGGPLVGTARWQGVRLADLLEAAGVDRVSDQLVGRSVDGFTAGFPVDVVRDGRPAMVALGMNGEPLPIDHGFPARLVVPGLYGYVSATKWLQQIELTTFADFEAFWIPRGWSRLGPIKPQSRIDLPRARASVAAGPVTVAGVAWAPRSGVAAVEVQVDDGPWARATLAPALGGDTWRQWTWTWPATPGRHELQVRTTTGAGVVQDATRRPTRPDGATGLHRVSVRVR